MMRVVTIAAVALLMLTVAGLHARSAITALHGEFAAVDALAVPAVAVSTRVQQQPHWVAISDYTAALARAQVHRPVPHSG